MGVITGFGAHRSGEVSQASGETETENRYSITSLEPDAARLNQCIRQHWRIENKLHWVLEVGFGEDLDRKRAGFAAQNFSVLNHLLKQDKTRLQRAASTENG